MPKPNFSLTLPRHAARAFVALSVFAAANVARAQVPKAKVAPAKPAAKTVPLDGANPALWQRAHAILAENCLSCHGPNKPKAGLRLDTRAGVLKGAESGPVLVENDPAKSPLAQVLHAGNEVQMPPKGPLKTAEIAALEAWIRTGCPFENEPATAPANTSQTTTAEKLDPQVVEWFETKVRPVLANNCYSCHGEKKQMASLRVDSKAALLKGSDNGPVIVAGDPDGSKLIRVIRHLGDIKMPQGKPQLPAEEIANLAQWVKIGAPWPGGEVSAAALAAAQNGDYVITPEQRAFWSFAPVRNYAPPKAKNGGWATSPLDNFILAALEKKGLSPNKPADRRTLIRRATYDLHGLPPTPAEIDAFVNDKAPDAWAKVIDRLLASPRYGERWGRHWLDIARYADTKGYVFNEDRRYDHAYNYRDWVVRAFNEDLPYDQFITQQLAADRLRLGDAMGDPRPLAALGFLRVGRRFLNSQPDIIDDRIDTTMRGFQGLSTACARCHDHKFDPIPTKDYYSLYGVFASSIEPEPQPISPKEIAQPWLDHRQKVNDTQNERDNLLRENVKQLRERLKNNEALPDEVKTTLAGFREDALANDDQTAKIEVAFPTEAREKLQGLKAQLETLAKNTPPAPELAMTMADADKPVEQHIFKRGNQGNQGDIAPRRFHAILSNGERPEWQGSGRLELAQAIASKTNPLTARVMVNRIWQHHFGEGLVRTPSDFGTRGDKPTHPELLDYLARKFMDDGWSMKKMHRMMMLSSTYIQSSAFDEQKFRADPENLLLWRQNRRRLEYEDLRDSLLAVAGQLDDKIGGPSVDVWQAPYSHRRTIYGTIERQNLPGIFRTFDFAGPDASAAQRFRTTVPQQALFMMNNDFVIEQAAALAHKPQVLQAKDDAARVNAIYHQLLGRAPDANEIALARKYLQSAATPAKPTDAPLELWSYGFGGWNAATKSVDFTPLQTFKDNQYRVGDKMPDEKLGYVSVTSGGGHPGNDAQHAAIRRWTAPQDATVAVSGTGNHPNEQGDGVELSVISNRSGELGKWVAFHGEAATKIEKVVVKKGDTLDFLASPRTGAAFDSFSWNVSIANADGKISWDSESGFRGPVAPLSPLSAWERYVQVLLMTNEFFFVD